MPLSQRQSTIYAGDTITVDGLTYTWNGSSYILNEIIPSQMRTVTVPFTGILTNSGRALSINLSGDELDVYVDGVLWNSPNVIKTTNNLQITFDENYLYTQRLITFKSNKGDCMDRFVIKSKVNSENDVVIIKFKLDEPIPTIGDYISSTPNNYTSYPSDLPQYISEGGGGTPTEQTMVFDNNNDIVITPQNLVTTKK